MKQVSKISRRRKSALADGSAEYKIKRDEIVQMASRLFKEKGYHSTTLADIAEYAGVDRATVYYYVGSKQELFREAVQSAVEKNVEEAERTYRDTARTPREKIEHLVTWLMRSYEEHYPHIYVYLQEEIHQIESATSAWAKNMVKQTHRLEEIFIELIKEGAQQGQFRSDIAPLLLMNSLFGMLNWTHRWFKPGKRSANEIAAAFCEVFLNGTLASASKATGRSARGGGAHPSPSG
jgi:TetR/AcrR family transcriptional regulator, cholesterol catabolism regulator